MPDRWWRCVATKARAYSTEPLNKRTVLWPNSRHSLTDGGEKLRATVTQPYYTRYYYMDPEREKIVLGVERVE